MRVYFLLMISIVLTLFSCEKDEIPVAPRTPGDVTISQVSIGGDYRDQIYYSLGEDKVISQNLRSIWDLSFESTDEGWHVLINSSTGMKVAYFEGADMNDELNINDVEWEYDASTGNLDSTAVGDWRSKEGVFVLNRGHDHLGTFLGFKKFILTDVNETEFTIEFAEIDENSTQTSDVLKNKSINFTQFSFDDGVVSVEPDKNSWDFLFTQYTYVFYDFEEIIPYQVTGVLINRNNVQAIMDNTIPFEDIDLEYATNSILSNETDVIGYDWKYFSLSEGYYTIYLDQIYIIKDVEGIYYKLHFTDFYSDSGVKGAPKFEFQKL